MLARRIWWRRKVIAMPVDSISDMISWVVPAVLLLIGVGMGSSWAALLGALSLARFGKLSLLSFPQKFLS